MIYYLQSCSYPYAGGDERSNEKIRDYLFSKGIFICGCCHYSQGLFREGDTVLMICSNCAEVTLENSPKSRWRVFTPIWPTTRISPGPITAGKRWSFRIPPAFGSFLR